MLTKNLQPFFEARSSKLFYYSPYSFFRHIAVERIQDVYINELYQGIENNKIQIINFTIYGEEFYFLLEYLDWDSRYFNMKTYKLHTILFKSAKREYLCLAVKQFDEYLKKNNIEYIFMEIPGEDISLLQALTHNGYNLIENRVTQFLDLSNLNTKRYNVRQAQLTDIPYLKKLAKEMRNPYDRFHADSAFTTEQADDFLATYAEESIKGLADIVYIPSENNDFPEAFLTANYLKEEWEKIGCKVSKMILAAVSPNYKGWYRKLLNEMAYHLREIGAEYVFLHPASSNKVGIHAHESLGYKFGKLSHILSKQNINITHTINKYVKYAYTNIY